MLKLVLVLSAVFMALNLVGGETDDPAKVKRIPPVGVPLKEADRTELEKGIGELGKEIEGLKTELKEKAALLALLPDVQIYFNAVRYAVVYNEFFNDKAPQKEIDQAKNLLKVGMERAKALHAGSAPWDTATGPVARGYVSEIDGSVQPYVLVVPGRLEAGGTTPRRLDIWYHGRGETLSELNFLQTTRGEFAPKDAFVLLPYGRYCNANKFAGEVDTFEALDNIRKHFKIDENRISVRGFSMGGASTWQFATHFPGLWAAANPGAGFSETPEFTHVFDPKNTGPKPTDYEQKLWHLYDSSHFCENLFNLPTVAYSGELDGQKQAADVMAREMKKVGLELTHIIGPGAHHNYEAKAKEEVAKRIDEIVAKGRNPVPKQIKFVTYTLRYNQAFWVTIQGLGEHWKKSRVEATIEGNKIEAATENVTILQFDLEQIPNISTIKINGKTVLAQNNPGAQGFGHSAIIAINDKDAALILRLPGESPVKRHGLQGPIDDAFMDSFIMVTPSSKPLNDKVGEWTKNEMAHAIEHWRRTFRGEARVVKDTDVTDAQIKESNLVLWGDPSSNAILAKIADKLPLKWNEKEVAIGAASYPAANHVALMIYPNPLNPQKYLVLNSGFTFRENEYLNNAKQNAKLPDWAIIDVTDPPTSKWPGKVEKAEFFDEGWGVKK
ncbi:MAG TPA: prolyl oligopeptidase family serine peptidase [Planctomycetota bacterium]|nr:prolyl oligopeptidase family serine peptidase [Planctomycetota bacterium]